MKMNRHERNTRKWWGITVDELAYVIEPDGTVMCLDPQELEEYINTHQNMDFVIHRVREDVVKFIEEACK